MIGLQGVRRLRAIDRIQNKDKRGRERRARQIEKQANQYERPRSTRAIIRVLGSELSDHRWDLAVGDVVSARP